jgi:hypothetical protein
MIILLPGTSGSGCALVSLQSALVFSPLPEDLQIHHGPNPFVVSHMIFYLHLRTLQAASSGSRLSGFSRRDLTAAMVGGHSSPDEANEWQRSRWTDLWMARHVCGVPPCRNTICFCMGFRLGCTEQSSHFHAWRSPRPHGASSPYSLAYTIFCKPDSCKRA